MDRTNSAENPECGIENSELRDTDAVGSEIPVEKEADTSAAPDRESANVNSPGHGIKNNAKRARRKEKPSDSDNTATTDNEDASVNIDQELQILNSKLANELAAEKDKYLRLAAEYDNFRKRSMKERETTYSDARADTVTRILPVYDNLERALKMECADEAFYKGIEMTMTQLTEILEGMNVLPIKAAGEPFDPNRHNAVMSVENPELGEKVVAEEFQKGFVFGERVIRHSTVIVAN